tara:strand:- start:286 stop:525 length:240 start_codon:yes stop_codon:yes gene_type:complete
MDNDIDIINNAINNTINKKYPNIEWGINDKFKKIYNIDKILLYIILLFISWSLLGILIAIIKRKNKILSILLGPLIIFR